MNKSLTDPTIQRRDGIYCDIAKPSTNKGRAIEVFGEKLNIPLRDTIAIGDGFNDIPMFKVVGHNVVMENANSKVKEFANELTQSNEEDGVAIFIEKMIRRIELRRSSKDFSH